MALIAKEAQKEAKEAGKAGSIVTRASKKIVPGRISKGLRPLIGRSIRAVLPIVGAGLAVFEFADNVQAHGVAGAALRATPVLGSLISAHDLGTELAKQIRDEADASFGVKMKELNDPSSEAWDKASEQTIAAFQELADRIKVTNTYGPEGLVDPQEVADALNRFREEMQHINLMKAERPNEANYSEMELRAKQELEKSLTEACQKNAPPPPNPLPVL